jgi:hypothetical protein
LPESGSGINRYVHKANIFFLPREASSSQDTRDKKKIPSLTDHNQKKSQKSVSSSSKVIDCNEKKLQDQGVAKAIPSPSLVTTDDLLSQVEKLAQQLTASTEDLLLPTLEALSSLSMTLSVLQATKIGIAVNRLRKTSADSSVVEASTLLVKRWNKLLTSSSKTEAAQKEIDQGENSAKAGKKTTELTKGKVEDVEAVREHCARLLGEALEANTSLAADCRIPAQQLAREIEQQIFLLFKETSQKYRSQVRKTYVWFYFYRK